MSRERYGPRYPIGSAIFVGAVLVFLFFPLVLMVLFSFHSIPRMSFPFEGFSTRWYRDVFDDPLVINAFKRTAVAAAATGAIASVIGAFAAFAMLRLGPRGKSIVSTAAFLPMVFPVLLYAIGLAIFYHQLGVGYSLKATIAGHVIVALPFVFLVIVASLENFRFSLLEAARDLGAGSWTAFRTVTLPIILPAVLGSMLLAMALSVDEFVIAFFTAGQQKTLPLILYGRLNQGVNPSLNAIGTVLLVTTTALAFISARRTTKEIA